jgi:hypothetical protein
VIRLDDRIVIKFGFNISLTDADITAYFRRHSPDIPVPQPLGVLSVSSMTYAFISLVKGRSLNKLWPNLSDNEKCLVRD